MINEISAVIHKLRKGYFEKENLVPWDINNGYCDQFADEVIRSLQAEENETLFSLSFLEMTNTGDHDWDDFYEKSVSAFNIQPTHGLSFEEMKETLLRNADVSHVWVTLKVQDSYYHFDAETPHGVDNPLKLKTFDKFLNARALGIKEDKMDDYLQRHRDYSIRLFKQSLEANDMSLSM